MTLPLWVWLNLWSFVFGADAEVVSGARAGVRRGCAPGRGPRGGELDLTFCPKIGQIRGMLRLRTSDEPSVQIGLRRDLGAGKAQVSTKPVSEKLSALNFQPRKMEASRAHAGKSSAGW